MSHGVYSNSQTLYFFLILMETVRGHLVLGWATRIQGNWPDWPPGTGVNF